MSDVCPRCKRAPLRGSQYQDLVDGARAATIAEVCAWLREESDEYMDLDDIASAIEAKFGKAGGG